MIQCGPENLPLQTEHSTVQSRRHRGSVCLLALLLLADTLALDVLHLLVDIFHGGKQDLHDVIFGRELPAESEYGVDVGLLRLNDLQVTIDIGA